MQVEINKRDYSEWSWRKIGTDKNKEIDINLNPLTLKLFNGDIVEKNGQLIHSNYSSNKHQPQIAGTLIINGKTYGRDKNNHKRLLYICVPEDKKLPLFLIPYDEKQIDFNKQKKNKYVLFVFKEWVEKHPIGIIINTIGYVDQLDSYYEYQLYSKNLITSLQQFIKATAKAIHPVGDEELIKNIFDYYNNNKDNNKIEDRTKGFHIFTIDPKGSLDFDDAFSIQEYSDYILISVYIANVPLILDYLQLWKSFTTRVSTIYLPNGKKNMLPPILADNLCSLQADKHRLAFTMDIKYRLSNNKITFLDISFLNTLIKVNKNYVYEEESLLKYYSYCNLFTVTKYLQHINPYIEKVTDSHDVVTYYMIMMNYECSKKMIEKKGGILRTTRENNDQNQNNNQNNLNGCKESEIIIPLELKQIIKILNSEVSGMYCDTLSSHDRQKGHQLIGNGLSSYTHITSPIRRLVDLINLIELQTLLNMITFNHFANDFCKEWIQNIDFINDSTKAIKKVQQNCALMNTLLTHTTSQEKEKEKEKEIYKGFIIEKMTEITIKKEIVISYYNVYIPSLKIVSSFKTNDDTLLLYSQANFIIKVFLDEVNLTSKIRLQKV